MTFGEPDALYLLFALPIMALVAFRASRKRRAAVERLGDPGLIERLSRSVSRRGRRIAYILWFAALAIAILALARPQWGSAVQPVEQRGVQMMVALDVSSSMLTRDVKPDRLTRAKLEIADLLERLKGDEVGLVVFSGSSFVQFPPTFDYSTARTFVDNAGPESISREGTDLVSGSSAFSGSSATYGAIVSPRCTLNRCRFSTVWPVMAVRSKSFQGTLSWLPRRGLTVTVGAACTMAVLVVSSTKNRQRGTMVAPWRE